MIYNGPLGTALPCVVRAANGDLLVQFNTGKDCWPGSTAYLIRSSDGGQTWSEPRKLIASQRNGGAIHTNVGLTLLSNDDLILPFIDAKLRDGGRGFPKPMHPGHEVAVANVIISHDHGQTWSGWVPAHGGVPWTAPFGRLVEMPDGRLLLPLWMSANATGPESGQYEKQGFSGFVVSSDGGQTWGDVAKLGHFGETSLLLLDDNRTLLACLKQHPSRLTHVMRSTDGKSWTDPRNFGVQGKNASLHLSPRGWPLILCSPVTPGPGEGTRPGVIFFTPDRGDTWRRAIELEEPIGPRGTFAYGLTAVNVDAGRMLVVFAGADPDKPEKGDSPWTSTQTYLGSNLVEETR